ncbi:hypothetical protein YB2330_006467 [Saitoella coloradoensis]
MPILEPRRYLNTLQLPPLPPQPPSRSHSSSPTVTSPSKYKEQNLKKNSEGGAAQKLVLGRRESTPLLPFQVQQLAYVYSPHKRQHPTTAAAAATTTSSAVTSSIASPAGSPSKISTETRPPRIPRSRIDPTPTPPSHAYAYASATDLSIIDPVLSSFGQEPPLPHEHKSCPMVRSPPAPRPDSEIFPTGGVAAPIVAKRDDEDTAQEELLIERIVEAALRRLLAAEGLKLTPAFSTTPSGRREWDGDGGDREEGFFEMFRKLDRDAGERAERILGEIGVLRSEVAEMRRHAQGASQAVPPVVGAVGAVGVGVGVGVGVSVGGQGNSCSKGAHGLFGSILRKSIGRSRSRANSTASTAASYTTPTYSSPPILPPPTSSNSDDRFDKLDASLARLTRKVDRLESQSQSHAHAHARSRSCTASTVMSPPTPAGVVDMRVNRLLWPRPVSKPAFVEVWRDINPELATTGTGEEAKENDNDNDNMREGHGQVGLRMLGHRVQRSSLDFGVVSVQGSSSSRPEHGLRIPGLDRNPSISVGKAEKDKLKDEERRGTGGLAIGSSTAKVREEDTKVMMEAKGKVREATPVAYRFMRELSANTNAMITTSTSTSTSPAKSRLSPKSGKRKGDAGVYGPQGSPLKKMISKPLLLKDAEMSPWTEHVLAGARSRNRAATVGEAAHEHARTNSATAAGLSCTSPARRRMTFGFGLQEDGGGAGVRRGMTLLERRRSKSLGGTRVRRLALVEKQG